MINLAVCKHVETTHLVLPGQLRLDATVLYSDVCEIPEARLEGWASVFKETGAIPKVVSCYSEQTGNESGTVPRWQDSISMFIIFETCSEDLSLDFEPSECSTITFAHKHEARPCCAA